jgi:hypothetical protein
MASTARLCACRAIEVNYGTETGLAPVCQIGRPTILAVLGNSYHFVLTRHGNIPSDCIWSDVSRHRVSYPLMIWNSKTITKPRIIVSVKGFTKVDFPTFQLRYVQRYCCAPFYRFNGSRSQRAYGDLLVVSSSSHKLHVCRTMNLDGRKFVIEFERNRSP